ncbi:MAG: polyribonucleotide nucleotidyltransferase [Actinobacteria bacterium]|nr:polyribonucleotide nucleotidyltransferase [Actinomycetota bacterium]MBL7123602.1 polyribonucleotide nucleotidyltransferase [Actinomycetota bacterium]
MEKRYEIDINGKKMLFSTGKIARQANSVLVKFGGNGVLVTVVMNQKIAENIDFLPLVVDVEERMYAAGKIPGGFFKREGRASDKAILNSRLTDRPLRPLFNKNIRNEIQIIATVLSFDQVNPYDILVMNGTSMALCISDIPFEEPVGAVRIAKVGENWIVNPVYSEIEESIIDIVVAGTEEAILMAEAGGKEVPEEVVLEAIERAHNEIKKIVNIQKEFKKIAGREKRETYNFELNKDVEKRVRELAEEKIQEILNSIMKYSKDDKKKILLDNTDKGYFQDRVSIIREETEKKLESEFPEDKESINESLNELERELVRKMILEKGVRPDGRKPDEIREISCEVGLFPETTHGMGLFTRGKTQALTILALGSIREAQKIDSLGKEEFKRYIHHYNFPPFSTGETRPLRGPKRRDIGHGALAEKALRPMIPDEDKFPYVLRLVSEILESNGSTSMASVCGSTLALMDAGVPILNPVSGIAMGLIKGEDDKFVILEDIQGIEDFYGDMDFKVAGTKNGITALQMDMKIKGINLDIIKQALEKAREGRLFILDRMLEVIPESRKSLSKAAPKITTFKIPKEKIGEVIGPGGKNIKSIKEEFDLDEIDISDYNGEGMVSIISSNDVNIKMARKRIEGMLKGVEDIKVGEEFIGTVVGITSYGAFINLIPGVDGLLHISKVTNKRIKDVKDYLKIGDKILVRVGNVDSRTKKIGLERTDI